jgi:type IV secretion system protein VirD4
MIAAIAAVALVVVAVGIRYPILFILLGLILAPKVGRRIYDLTTHGTARWANRKDLDQAGMFGGTGLPVGEISINRPTFWAAFKDLFDQHVPSREACERFMLSMRKLQRVKPQGEMVRLNKAVHTAVFAPTGVGKGVSLVIPHLLGCPDSCVVIDPKGENAKLTATQRKAMGHRVILLDPFKVVTQEPDTFNPLDAIDPHSPTALDDCRALAEALVVRTGEEKDPHWNDSAEAWIAAMIALAVVYGEGENRSLQSVRTLLTDPAKMQQAIEVLCKSDAWDGMLARMGHQLQRFMDKELSSVLTTVNRHMRFLDTVSIAASTKASSFDSQDLRNGRMTIYLILPPEFLRSQSALLRMWIGSLLRACVRAGLQEANKVHFVLDEAASLGRMEPLEDAVDKYRGYGVRLQFYYQSLGQLKQTWRDGMDQSLLSNTTQIYFGVNDYSTAEHVSNMLGETTIIVNSGSSNKGGSSQTTTAAQLSHSTGESWTATQSWQNQARRLLKPEEVIALNQRLAVTFTPGVRPIITRLTRYYEGPSGKARSRWGRIQTLAEIWVTAFLMLLTSALAVWAAANPDRFYHLMTK